MKDEQQKELENGITKSSESINSIDSKLEMNNKQESRHQSFSFLTQPKPTSNNKRTTNERKEEELRAIQRDINHVYIEVDITIEFTLITMCFISAMLAFSEILKDTKTFQKAYKRIY
jgi:hypothetical protein